MVFKNFRLNIIVRIIVLMLAMTAVAWFIVQAEPIRAVYTGILVILLMIEFFHYADKLTRDLNQFLLSIIHEDYTSVFKDRGKGKRFRELYQTMDEITLKFRALNKEKEMRSQYLFSLIEQVKVGIISFDPEGRIHLVNKSLLHMLDMPGLRIGSNLKEIEPELFSTLETAALSGKQLLKKKIRNEVKEFSIAGAGFRMESKFYHLVSLQDIHEELDARELEAWQKLIRVLTHEIMNSVSPITSLTGSLNDLVSKSNSGSDAIKVRERLQSGLRAIQERSTGLIKFTEAYQHLARIPAPVIIDIETASFAERLGILFKAQFESARIRFKQDIRKAPKSFAGDQDLLEQVLINLIKNAAEAVENQSDPEVKLEMLERSDGRISIRVKDNGVGIPADILDRIFIPFFSTRDQGSGIGLSLSRQIILMHHGSITVESNRGVGSTFEVIL